MRRWTCQEGSRDDFSESYIEDAAIISHKMNSQSQYEIIAESNPVPYEKPHIPNGLESTWISSSYYDSILPFINMDPLLFSSRMRILFTPKNSFRWNLLKLIQNLKSAVITTLRHKKKSVISIKSLFLFVYSSDKQSWREPMEMLAKRMVQRGYTCAIFNSRNIRVIENNKECIKLWDDEQFNDLIHYGVKRADNLFSFAHSLLSTVFLALIMVTRNLSLFTVIFKDPVSVFNQIFYCAKRKKIADFLLLNLKPKIIITNGDHAMFSSEIVTSKLTQISHKICFFNENTYRTYFPIFSDEIWVWNDTMANAMSIAVPAKKKFMVTVTGRAELDLVLKANNKPNDYETELKNKTASKNILLYLDQYNSGFPFDYESPSLEAIKWLAQAARNHPDWFILFKTRPLHHEQRIPGLELIEGLDNFIIPEREIEYSKYLKWDNLISVAALFSTGLYIAAGMGKVSLRLDVSIHFSPEPVLDEISKRISSPNELMVAMSEMSEGKILAGQPESGGTIFPYRGSVIERMEQVCMDRIAIA